MSDVKQDAGIEDTKAGENQEGSSVVEDPCPDEPCRTCSGTGLIHNYDFQCPDCGGSGMVGGFK